jgi:hypothetical protein
MAFCRTCCGGCSDGATNAVRFAADPGSDVPVTVTETLRGDITVTFGSARKGRTRSRRGLVECPATKRTEPSRGRASRVRDAQADGKREN